MFSTQLMLRHVLILSTALLLLLPFMPQVAIAHTAFDLPTASAEPGSANLVAGKKKGKKKGKKRGKKAAADKEEAAEPVLPAAEPEAAPEAEPVAEPEILPLPKAEPAAPDLPLEPPPTDVEVIKAAPDTAAQGAGSSDVAAVGVTAANGGAPTARLGLVTGGFLPIGDLRIAGFVGLGVELPLQALAGLPLDLYFEAGWSPVRQQQEMIIPGRGKTNLIQNTLAIPLELGARYAIALGGDLPLTPYAGAGLAVDITRTELKAFSVPAEAENDVSVGVAVAAGAALALGSGRLTGELRYRVTQADLGAWQQIAEPHLGRAAVHVAYLLNL